MTTLANNLTDLKTSNTNPKSYKKLTPEKDGVKGGRKTHWLTSEEKAKGIEIGENLQFAIEQWADGETLSDISSVFNRKGRDVFKKMEQPIKKALKNNIHIHKETAKVVLLLLKTHLKHLQHIMENEGGGNMRVKWFQTMTMVRHIEFMFFNGQLALNEKSTKEMREWVDTNSTHCKNGLIGSLENDKKSKENSYIY